MWTPGATQSTPRVAPRFGHGEKDATESSSSVAVPNVSVRTNRQE